MSRSPMMALFSVLMLLRPAACIGLPVATAHLRQQTLVQLAESAVANATDEASSAANLEAAALSQVDSSSKQTAAQDSSQLQQSSAQKPFQAGWFGGFDQMESTFTYEGVNANMDENSAKSVQYGWDPGSEYPAQSTKDKKAVQWFHESPSAGATDAWQTHYPATDGTFIGKGHVENGKWYSTPQGWMQAYKPSKLTKAQSSPGQREAMWFDSSVGQYDGFGRLNLPYPETPRRYQEAVYDSNEAWLERAVNTTIACPSIGCTANATLQAFDAFTEEAANCKLNINVHATDYDNDWSRENIDYWTVSGKLVKALCDPMARGCNETAARPLYSCLNSFGVDHLVDSTGALFIEGRISRMVDECPYEGNLLSGVAMVTCLVRKKSSSTVTTTTVDLGSSAASLQERTLDAKTTLRCSSPGCTASGLLQINPMIALLGGACFMNVSVVQTDFDDDLGEPEEIEFLEVEGLGKISNHVQPGKNPCNMEFQGLQVTQDQRIYNLIENHNVTELIKQSEGAFRVTGKISHHVDECASENAYLLDGLVHVRCRLPAATSV